MRRVVRAPTIPIMTKHHFDKTAGKPLPPCSPSELKRFKMTCGIVLILSALVLVMAMAFGNLPRTFVDRMNLVLGPVMVINFLLCGYALWRFRRACIVWGREKRE